MGLGIWGFGEMGLGEWWPGAFEFWGNRGKIGEIGEIGEVGEVG